jgi:hypothetical protein
MFWRLLLASVYLCGCFYFAVLMLGGGHGTLIFVMPLITLPAFALAIVLLRPSATRRVRQIAAALVLFHYLFTGVVGIIVESGDGFVHARNLLENSTLAFILPTAWYILGNIIFWVLFVRARSSPHAFV